jgi:hypothetical protein
LDAIAPLTPRVVEVAMQVVPEDGLSIYTALQRAELAGFRSIEVHDDNTATVVFYRQED